MLELSQFNQFMLDYLDPEIRLVEDVGRYILSAGGKRLRPLLMMEVCRMEMWKGWFLWRWA
jgi:octaprenyl-diphosphate synthase